MRRVVGCMTGTSIDGLDLALVEVDGHGLEIRARVVRTSSRPLGELGAPLRALAAQEPATAGEIARLAWTLGGVHAAAVAELLAGDRADLVCVHGQTVYHRPPTTWQLLQPAPIARALGCPVVFDLRAADAAAGGQGAPITPIADWVLFRGSSTRAVVNLGGFCNVTRLPASGGPELVRAGDVCVCNQLLDDLARRLLRSAFDEGGAAAARGHVHDDALVDLEGVLAARSGPRRSLGTGDEAGEWISRWRAHVPAEDLARTACEAIAEAVARATGDADEVLLAGGGVKHATLASAIASASSARVTTTAAAGIDPTFREAVAFAVLGALCHDRVPITLPAVTGCAAPAPISGSWAGL